MAEVPGGYKAWAEHMKSPDITPSVLDGSMESWLHRLTGWGVVSFRYGDAFLRRPRHVTKSEFLELLTNPAVVQILGAKYKWHRTDINKLVMIRTYKDATGKERMEKFYVDIELKDEIKRILGRR